VILLIKQDSNTTHTNTYKIQNNDANSEINLLGFTVQGSGSLDVLGVFTV